LTTDSEAAIVTYRDAAFKDDDPHLIVAAMADVTRARPGL
jgi:hypothetical protein